MSDERNPTQTEETVESSSERTEFTLRYQGESQVFDQGENAEVAFFGNTNRTPVRARGRLRDPLRIREALSVVYDIVKSDFRYTPKDRSAYMAFQRMRNRSSRTDAFDAQRQYFEWLKQNDPNAWLILDPIITVHPDELLFEVFSKDEGSYARLSVDLDALELEGEVTYGTTNIDYSEHFYDSVQRMRSYRETFLGISQDAVEFETEGGPKVLEKQVRVPNTWLRGFLQVQSAATLPHTTISIAPIDLYNVLRHLRMNADQKRGGRAIRVELVPGEHPRLVLEPWETVIETHGEIYTGRMARVVRIWGRRRLMLLRRILPFVESVDIHLLGTGLPSFYVLRCGAVTFTVGLTGFTSSNWSQQLSLDTLLPRTAQVSADEQKVLGFLDGKWVATTDEIEQATGLTRPALRAALLSGCQHGRLMYDIARESYRLRSLTEEPLDLEKLEFRNNRERQAHDLLAGKGGKVTLESENRIQGVGTQYIGTVEVEADRREYRAELLIDETGRVKKADCTSSFFRKHQLKEGPSVPLIALRLKIAEEQKKRAEQRGKGAITFETRTYVKRHERGEDIYQISLEEQRIKVRFGLRSRERLRSQNLMFNTIDEARQAYFQRIRDLELKGYMDATAG